jgi:hypothetical protein
MDETLRVDVRAMQERFAKATRGLDNAPLWFGRWFCEGLLLLASMLIVIPALVNQRFPTMSELTSRGGIFEIVMTVILAAGLTVARYRKLRKVIRTPSEVLEANMNKNWLYYVGQGWTARVLRMGVFVALGIGIPIGTLIAMTSSPSELPGGSRLMMILFFTGMTAAWAVPMMFIIRFFTVRSQRKLMRVPCTQTTT